MQWLLFCINYVEMSNAERMIRMSQKYNEIYKEKLVEMFIGGEKVTDIAKLLDVERQTVYNWLDKKEVKIAIDKRRRQLANQGNQIIMKDLDTYIANIKELANDKSDKRTSLAANQYLINRIYGNTAQTIITKDSDDMQDFIPLDDLEKELDEFDEE